MQRLDQSVTRLLKSQVTAPSYEQSIVEIVQNSIDAGATKIDVNLQPSNYGFVVNDNGCGMKPDDMDKIGRSYTSKCASVKDLRDLRTYGFRGEALVSIGDLSMLTITSKVKEYASGYTIRIGQGKKLTGYMEPCEEQGTKVVVTNLFGNMPVRRQKVSINKVKDLLYTTVIGNNGIQVNVFLDGGRKFTSREFKLEGKKVEVDYGEIKMSGFITGGKTQLVLVNRRKLIAPQLYRKLSKKYGMSFIFFVTAPLTEHELVQNPQKEIYDSKLVDKISKMITGTAEELQKLSKKNKAVNLPNVYGEEKNYISDKQQHLDFKTARVNAKILEQKDPTEVKFDTSRFFSNGVNKPELADLKIPREALTNCQLIAQIENAFIMVKLKMDKEGYKLLVLFDQHAADERVRLERYVADFVNLPKQPKELNTPTQVQVPEEYIPLFKQWGVLIDKDRVTHIPQLIESRAKESSSFVKQLIDDHVHALNTGNASKLRLPTSHSIIRAIPSKLLSVLNSNACRSAIMFGDELTFDLCQELIYNLSKCDLPFQCAHGRPSIVPLTKI